MGNNPRNLVFVSHANPEDDEFSLWLTLQLARQGYRVWCDLTRLLGGEDFWADIEAAIRGEAIKLIYVLSRASNNKSGPLQELHVAQSVARSSDLKDFVIPVRVDDLPFGDVQIQLARLNVIDFHNGWAPGLRSLVEKLEADGVEKDPRFSPESVANWWRSSMGTENGLIDSSEEYLSNRFAIRRMPGSVFLHSTEQNRNAVIDSEEFKYPASQIGDHIVSFASEDDLQDDMYPSVKIRRSELVAIQDFVRGIRLPIELAPHQSRNIIVDLLRQGWDRKIDSAQMSKHQWSNGSSVGFLRDGQVQGNRVKVPSVYGLGNYRQIVGYRSQKNSSGQTRRRYWHFAIGSWATLRPFRGYKLIPHLLFSDDGQTIWKDSGRLHRARRSASRDWWNPEWRDRTLGIVNWLAGDEQHIEIPFGSQARVRVDARPISFESPVSYSDPEPGNSPASEIFDPVEFDIEDDS